MKYEMQMLGTYKLWDVVRENKNIGRNILKIPIISQKAFPKFYYLYCYKNIN